MTLLNTDQVASMRKQAMQAAADGVRWVQMDLDVDMQHEDTKQYVADLLNSQIAHPSFQLTPDQVYISVSH